VSDELITITIKSRKSGVRVFNSLEPNSYVDLKSYAEALAWIKGFQFATKLFSGNHYIWIIDDSEVSDDQPNPTS
jgi:hypothetical protein